MFSHKLESSSAGWRKAGSMLASLALHGLIAGVSLISAVLATQNYWDDCRPRIQVASLAYTPRPGDPRQLEQQPNTLHIPKAAIIPIDPNASSVIRGEQTMPLKPVNSLLVFAPVAPIPKLDRGWPGVCGCISGPLPSGRSNPSLPFKTLFLAKKSSLHQAVLVRKVDPEYPNFAKRAGIQGAVIIRATIDREGAVTALSVIAGPTQLRSAAVDAVRQWRYQPYVLDGLAVEIQTTITVKFVLPDQNQSRVL